MDIYIDEPKSTDGEVQLAYTLFMDAVQELRQSKRELSSLESVLVVETLMGVGAALDLVNDADWAHRVARFAKSLRSYRDARSYFVSPDGNAALHAEIVGLDGHAAVSKIRTECVLNFNSMLAAQAVDAHMLDRKQRANKG